MAALPEGHWIHNSNPFNYVLDISSAISSVKEVNLTPSHRVVRALQMIKPEICTKRFASKVLDAIFNDGVEEELFDESYRTRYVRRLNRWFGKSGAKRLLIKRCEILDCWKNRDSGFVPDAFLIDTENKTIVCYEVEDHHPLNPFSVGRYSNAWWTLEYIYWDLHLIEYDIYGNARVIAFPSSDFLSREVRDRRNPPIA